MIKQKKLSEAEEYETPLDTLLSFLRVPYKIYRSIYISIIERDLSSKPLIQSEVSIAYLAEEANIEPALMTEKIKNMVKMKWIEFKQVGDRDTNQIFVISPIWRYKPGIDKAKFAIALQQYKAGIVEDKECQMSTEEIYELMSSVCPHTETKVDPALCELARWSECKTCTYNSQEGKEDK